MSALSAAVAEHARRAAWYARRAAWYARYAAGCAQRWLDTMCDDNNKQETNT